MNRQQQINNKAEKKYNGEAQQKSKAEKIGKKNEASQEVLQVIKPDVRMMSQSAIQVEALRTVVTPRGRKFVPREPRRFELPQGAGVDLYATLRDKLLQHFPRLQGDFTVMWRDANDDMLPLVDEKSVTEALHRVKDGALPIFVQGECSQGKYNKQKENAPQCSNCNGDIGQVRTKCLECEHFILCGGCEAKGLHADHVMVKCERPRFFNFALARFADAIPALCKHHKENASDAATLPRLEPKQVRQFWLSQQKLHKKEHGDEKKEHCDEAADRQGQRDEGRRHMRQMWRHFLHNISDEAGNDAKEKSELVHQDCPMGWKKGQNVTPKAKCGHCQIDITGIRNKCLECDDFNLCEKCDLKGEHTDHVMVQGDRPRFFFFALPMFKDVLPELCETHKEQNSIDGKVPRLQVKEVRQFWQSKRKQQREVNRSNVMSEQPTGCMMHNSHKRWMEARMMQEDKKRARPDDWEYVSMDTADQPDHATGTDQMDTDQECPEKPRMRQIKRQWMRNCMQSWKEQMKNATEETSQQERGSRGAVRYWRPYMRTCWDQWQELSKGDAETGEQRPQPRRQDHCAHRREWIQNCWRLWREEAGKMTPQDSTEEEGQSEGESFPGRFARCRGPFPGYHMMMNKSWKLMNDQQKSENQQPTSEEEAGEQLSGNDDDYTGESQAQIGPKMAYQKLKQAWVNGCRDLWWIQLRKITAPEGATGDKIKQIDAMKEMSAQPKIRQYLRECWQLWKQLSQKAGLVLKTNQSDKGSQDGANDEVSNKAKQTWMREMIPVWKEDIPKQSESDDQKQEPMWDKRPFPRWRPLIMRSWQKIAEHSEDPLHTRQQLTQAVREEYMQNLKKASAKHFDQQMKKMSLDERTPDSEHPMAGPRGDISPRAGPQGSTDEATSSLTAEERKELHRKVMKQFWSLMEQGEGSGCAHASRRGARGRVTCGRQSWRHCGRGHHGNNREHRAGAVGAPRLKLKLSMRSRPSNQQ